MNKQLIALSMVIVAQILVLLGMVASASMPLWTGQEVRLAVAPVDPRSLFRGNYALLGYEISRFPRELLKNSDDLRHGEIIYITLKDQNGIATFGSVSLEMPEERLFIRGRLQNPSSHDEQFRVSYGLEAFFAPIDEALEIEKRLADGAVAVVMITTSGKAALVRVEAKPEE